MTNQSITPFVPPASSSSQYLFQGLPPAASVRIYGQSANVGEYGDQVRPHEQPRFNPANTLNTQVTDSLGRALVTLPTLPQGYRYVAVPVSDGSVAVEGTVYAGVQSGWKYP